MVKAVKELCEITKSRVQGDIQEIKMVHGQVQAQKRSKSVDQMPAEAKGHRGAFDESPLRVSAVSYADKDGSRFMVQRGQDDEASQFEQVFCYLESLNSMNEAMIASLDATERNQLKQTREGIVSLILNRQKSRSFSDGMPQTRRDVETQIKMRIE